MEHIKMLAMKNVAQQEKIIKEIAEQGYNYLIIKQETTYDGNTAKTSYKYQGSNYPADIPGGYELYDLSKVKKYLKGCKDVYGE